MLHDILMQIWAAQVSGINHGEYDFYAELVCPHECKFRVSVGEVSTEVSIPPRIAMDALGVEFQESKGAIFVIEDDEAPDHISNFLSAQDWDDGDNQFAVVYMVEQFVNSELEKACDNIRTAHWQWVLSYSPGLKVAKDLSKMTSDLKEIEFVTGAARLLQQYQK